MTKVVKNIVSILLLVIFPLSAFGISVNSHFCSTKNLHTINVFESQNSCNSSFQQLSNNDKSTHCSCSDESMVNPKMDHSCCKIHKQMTQTDDDCIAGAQQNYNRQSLGNNCCSSVSQSYSIIDSFVFSSIFQFHLLDLANVKLTDIVSDFIIQNIRENTLSTRILDPPILELVNNIIFCIHQSSKSTEDSDSHSISFC